VCLKSPCEQLPPNKLGLLAKADIPPLEVLSIATRNGAEALGMLAEIGAVEERRSRQPGYSQSKST